MQIPREGQSWCVLCCYYITYVNQILCSEKLQTWGNDDAALSQIMEQWEVSIIGTIGTEEDRNQESNI